MRPPVTTFSLEPKMVGSRYFNASSARSTECDRVVSADAWTKTPSLCSRAIVANAPSKSSAAVTRIIWRCTPSVLLAGSIACRTVRYESAVVLQSTPNRVACGRASLKIARRLAARSDCRSASPVMFPQGARETRHVTKAHWVGMGREHDGDRLCRLSCWLYLSRRGCEDNINIRVGQLGS